MTGAAAALDAVWRAEAPKLRALLARRVGDLQLAEEALGEAAAAALTHWGDGVPDNPGGWLMTVAWRTALDRLRRDAAGRQKLALLAAAPPPEPRADDRLALVFACCHPTLTPDAQAALTLNAVCGLSAAEIAAAFLVPEPTMAQRLVRAKRRLRERGVRFTPPEPAELPARLPAVLGVLYLLFNEGYLANSAHTIERREVAREAVELGRQLAVALPSEPEVGGLVALLELHEARAAARFDAWGRIILLEEQDRSRWDRSLIASATSRLGRAMALERPGPYQLEAAIAALHGRAPTYQATDWATIRALYDELYRQRPSPVVLLGRAVATRYTAGPAAALAEVDALDGLAGYRLLHATRADLLRALGRWSEARAAAAAALALATNPAERELLARRLAATPDPDAAGPGGSRVSPSP